MSSFTQFFIHENCFELFYLLIFYFVKFSTWIWRLPYTWSLNSLLFVFGAREELIQDCVEARREYWETTLETRRELEPKCVPQLFLGSLPRPRLSTIGHFFSKKSNSPRSLCANLLGPVSFSFLVTNEKLAQTQPYLLKIWPKEHTQTNENCNKNAFNLNNYITINTESTLKRKNTNGNLIKYLLI